MSTNVVQSRGQCLLAETCSQCCIIQMDLGLFQRIPFASIDIEEAHDIRKNCEHPFNLLKHQVGFEKIRVRSQQATMARCTMSTIAVLLIKTDERRGENATTIIGGEFQPVIQRQEQYRPTGFKTRCLKRILL